MEVPGRAADGFGEEICAQTEGASSEARGLPVGLRMVAARAPKGALEAMGSRQSGAKKFSTGLKER